MRRLILSRKPQDGRKKKNGKVRKQRRAARSLWLLPVLYGSMAVAALGGMTWAVHWSFASGLVERTGNRIKAEVKVYLTDKSYD